ncbi:MAG TPA: peptide chain release factor N(5)-glutamine methyltransferase [Deltaproteobacteria bacterium]|nr:peptide chain release factor N(5)-glutamine methyltransferase [Deltaproteobacteria bacterium]
MSRATTTKARIRSAEVRLREAATVAEAVGAAEELLEAGGVDGREALLAASHLTGVKPAELRLRMGGLRAAPRLPAALASVVERRVGRREPLQYILGEQEFRGLALAVTPDVLIPRPETELVVDEALRALGVMEERAPWDGDGPAVLDLCTGSGAIAVAMALERPDARVVAADISEPALAVARSNAERHGVADRLEFVAGDLFDALDDAAFAGPFDLVVSNPPYVASADIEGLDPELFHEPRIALDGGPDGLRFIGRIAREAAPRLRRGAAVVVEIGYGQGGDVEHIFRAAGRYGAFALRRDYAGIERIATAWLGGE